MRNIKRKPLISVIVPVYKVEQYLVKCVNSIIAQTYSNIEIILVDDGSPDKSGELCDSLAKLVFCIIDIYNNLLLPTIIRWQEEQ